MNIGTKKIEVLFSTGVTVAIEESILELPQRYLRNTDDNVGGSCVVPQAVEGGNHMIRTLSEDDNPNSSESESESKSISSSDATLFSLQSDCGSYHNDSSRRKDFVNSTKEFHGKRQNNMLNKPSLAGHWLPAKARRAGRQPSLPSINRCPATIAPIIPHWMLEGLREGVKCHRVLPTFFYCIYQSYPKLVTRPKTGPNQEHNSPLNNFTVITGTYRSMTTILPLPFYGTNPWIFVSLQPCSQWPLIFQQGTERKRFDTNNERNKPVCFRVTRRL